MISGDFQTDMLMTRMNVSNFIITGNEANIDKYNNYLQEMDNYLAFMRNNNTNIELAKKVEELNTAKVAYNKAFSEVIGLKGQRNDILHNTLNVIGPKMEKQLTKIMESVQSEGDNLATLSSGLAMKHLLLAELYTTKFLESNNQSEVDRVLKEFKQMNGFMNILEQILQDSEHRNLFTMTTNEQKIYVDSFDALVEVIYASNEIITNTLDRIGPEITTKVKEIMQAVKNDQDSIGIEVLSAGKRGQAVIVGVSVVAVILSTLMLLLTIRNVLSQLGADPAEISDIVRSVAEGNLKRTFKKARNNANYGVYGDVELMSNNLKAIFTEINSGIQTLTSSSGELSNISNHVSSNCKQTTQKAKQAASSAKEVSLNMERVAAASEQAANNVEIASAASEQISITINEIATNTATGRNITENAVDQAQSASLSIQELGTAAESVGRVTEAINEISEQTNLLALNATIEAARAGEGGKGFAVVANEIKDLAKQTAEATHDISKRIEGMQNSTINAITEIRQIETIINDINDIVSTIASSVEEQSTSTKEIAGNVNQAALGIKNVYVDVNKSAQVVGNIANDIFEIDQASRKITDGGTQVNLKAVELAEFGLQLNKIVSRFKV